MWNLLGARPTHALLFLKYYLTPIVICTRDLWLDTFTCDGNCKVLYSILVTGLLWPQRNKMVNDGYVTAGCVQSKGFLGSPVIYLLSRPAPPWVCLLLRPWRGAPGPGHQVSSSCARTQPWPAAAPSPHMPAPCCLSLGPACSSPGLLWTRRGK